jgi:orotate phosphoribosyltransferase
MSANGSLAASEEEQLVRIRQERFERLSGEALEFLERFGYKRGDEIDQRKLLLDERQGAVGIAYARIMADRLRHDALVPSSHYDVVVGLRRGGDRLAQFLVVNLEKDTRRSFQSAFVSKDEATNEYFGTALLEAKVRRRRVLFVDHQLTTGDTVTKGMEIVRSYGGEIVALAVSVNRCPKTAEELGVPHLISLIRL